MDGEPPISEVRKLQLAYRTVLGTDAARTPSQSLVWRDIESFCHAYRLSPEKNSLNNVDDRNTYINEGRRSFWLRARGQILLASIQPKPITVTRKRKP
jgi:hypothetical protein